MNDMLIFIKNEKDLDAFIKTKNKFYQDIEREFQIEKCAMLIMKNGRKETSEGIGLQIRKVSEHLEKK